MCCSLHLLILQADLVGQQHLLTSAKRVSNYEHQRAKRPRCDGSANNVQTTFDPREQSGEQAIATLNSDHNNTNTDGLEAECPSRSSPRCQNDEIESISHFKDEECCVNNVSFFEFLALVAFSGDSEFSPVPN
jgi:hypothetical protein